MSIDNQVSKVLFDINSILYDKVLESAPDNINCLIGKGWAFRALYEKEEAIICFEKALKLDTKDIDCLKEIRQMLESLDRCEEEAICCDKILKLNPNDTDCLERKVKLLSKLNRYEEAVDCCDKILKLKPNDVDSLVRKADLLYSIGAKKHNNPLYSFYVNDKNADLSDEVINYFDKAVRYYDQSLKLCFNYEVLDNKTNLLMHLKKYEEAISCCDKILEQYPGNYYDKWGGFRKPFLQKTSALVELGRLEEAIDCCDKILKETTEPQPGRLSNPKRNVAVDEKKRLKKLRKWWQW